MDNLFTSQHTYKRHSRSLSLTPSFIQNTQMNLKINYYGYFTPLGGYGIANINWVKHLKRLGVDVSPHAKFKPLPDSYEWSIMDAEEKAIFSQPYVKRKIGVIETNPFDFDTNVSEVRVANTMCETDHVNSTWRDKLNSMQYIVVPNTFNKEVFINSGVTSPIKVIPHGVDSDTFPYYDRPKRDIYTFGMVGYLDDTDRKGAFDTIRAFSSEFIEDEPVRLIIKSSNPRFGYYRSFKDKRISIITENMSKEELNMFYQSIDCFVFPSKAEGVGYPPREAMLTGLPTIITNWSGLSDIAFSDICYPLKPVKLVPRPHFIEQDGNWALIDIAELMYTMRHVYKHQMDGRYKGYRAANYLRETASWEVCAYQLKEFLCTLHK